MADVTSGIGYDCHRLAFGRPLILGGIRLEHDRGLEGHSDADVLTHAIIDAMLGACALGDIGEHFPDTDPRFEGIDSIELLILTEALLGAAGFEVTHIDATVLLERPKLAPVRDQMRARLADALRLDLRHVSVKATRGERMGFVGREEGIAAMAVATVRTREPKPA
jgi:2-C-methyl-D-erythritol 2,4-cyclodiphosphate synthase